MNWEAKLKKWLDAVPIAKVRLAITVALIALMIYLLAELTTQLLPQEPSKGSWHPQLASHTEAKPAQDISVLQKIALFGKKDEQKPVEIKPVEAPKTKLNLKLTGLVASRDPKVGSAVIDSKGSQGTYGVEELIDGTRAVIKEIYPDRVMISNGGAIEALILDDDYALSSFEDAEPSHENPSKPTKRVPRQRNVEENAELSHALSEIQDAEGAEKLAKITEFIIISPVREDGEMKGFRVNPGKDRTLFEATGLQPGDLAVALNGYDLTDLTQTAAVMQELNTMTSLSLSVERDGQLYDFLLELP